MSSAAVDPDRGKPLRPARIAPRGTIGAAAAIGLFAAIGMPAAAEPMTFDEALALAGTSAPQLRASALGVEAASAASAAAGRLPDPQLRFGIDDLPVSGPMAGRFGDDEMTMARIGLMQEVPSRARRRAERAVAEADIDVAAAADALARREARIAAGVAWLDLHYAGRRLAALEEVLSALELLWEAAPAAQSGSPTVGADGASTSQAADATTADGAGVITAVDPAAGTITINHEAIRSIGWPAMTMTFKASPAVLREAAVGDRIQFDLTVRDGAGEVTAIYPH